MVLTAKFVVGKRSDGIYEALHNAGVFADDPSEVSRVIIDLQCGEAARIYVQKFADDHLVDVLMRGEVELVERARTELELVEPEEEEPG